MPRFIVGQKYYFVRTLFEMKEPRFGRLYYPWLDKLQSIDVITLVCGKEYDVAWDQDPDQEKKYKGYILLDEGANRWANQYPNASYGQLDDSADRRVRRYFETSELLQVDAKGDTMKDSNGNYIRKPGTEKLWEIFGEQMLDPFELATSAISRIYRGIHNVNTQFTEVQTRLLQEYLDDLTKKVEYASKQKIEYKPYVFKDLETGEPKPSRLLHAVLV